MEVPRTTGLGVVGTRRRRRADADPQRTRRRRAGRRSRQWTVNPWEATIRDGCVFGRGACDMKGGLAAALAALRALAVCARRLAGASRCTRWSPRKTAARERWPPPARSPRRRRRVDGADRADAGPAHAGALTFRIRDPGLSAHGCVREEGVSAIETVPAGARCAARARSGAQRAAATAAVRALPAPLRALGRPDECGRLAFVGPGSAGLRRADYGIAPGENAAAAKIAFERDRVGRRRSQPIPREHPPTVEWWGGQFLPAETDERAHNRHDDRRRITDVTGTAAARRRP